jgi:hypothetical protein
MGPPHQWQTPTFALEQPWGMTPPYWAPQPTREQWHRHWFGNCYTQHWVFRNHNDHLRRRNPSVAMAALDIHRDPCTQVLSYCQNPWDAVFVEDRASRQVALSGVMGSHLVECAQRTAHFSTPHHDELDTQYYHAPNVPYSKPLLANFASGHLQHTHLRHNLDSHLGSTAHVVDFLDRVVLGFVDAFVHLPLTRPRAGGMLPPASVSPPAPADMLWGNSVKLDPILAMICVHDFAGNCYSRGI